MKPSRRRVRAQATRLIRRTLEPTGAGEYVRRAAVSHFLNSNWRPGARILDLGGGEGNLCEALRPDLQVNYTVIDVDGGRHGTRVVADITNTPFPRSSADGVCMSDVLEHIEDDVAAICEALRVTCKNGYLVLHVPSQRQKPFAFLQNALEAAEASFHQQFPHVRDGYTFEGLSKMLDNIDGAEIISIQPSFSSLQSLVSDIDGFLWWKHWTLLRVFPWLAIRLASRARVGYDNRRSSGYLAVLHKTG
jgi:ubiquinone/menaquinone biosynthesis C-methylase UbiE